MMCATSPGCSSVSFSGGSDGRHAALDVIGPAIVGA